MAMAHYRVYELDSADHVLNGYSVVCRSDAAAMAAACKITECAAAVEVWESARCVAHLSAAQAPDDPWDRLREQWVGSPPAPTSRDKCTGAALGPALPPRLHRRSTIGRRHNLSLARSNLPLRRS